MTKEITYKINKSIKVLTENSKGYTKELNLVSWNGGTEKLDIREWYPDHERCGKGITLTETEGIDLMNALIEFFADKK